MRARQARGLGRAQLLRRPRARRARRRAGAQPDAAQRVGPEPADPARHGPARRGARVPHGRAAHGGDDRRDARRGLQGVDETVARAARGALRDGLPARRGDAARDRAHVGREPVVRRATPGRGVREQPPQLVQALAGAGRDAEHARVGEPVLGREPAQVGEARVGVGGREPVHLVEHEDDDRAVPRERAQVALVQRGVRVLLRVDDPHEQVGALDEAFRAHAVLDDD